MSSSVSGVGESLTSGEGLLIEVGEGLGDAPGGSGTGSKAGDSVIVGLGTGLMLGETVGSWAKTGGMSNAHNGFDDDGVWDWVSGLGLGVIEGEGLGVREGLGNGLGDS